MIYRPSKEIVAIFVPINGNNNGVCRFHDIARTQVSSHNRLKNGPHCRPRMRLRHHHAPPLPPPPQPRERAGIKFFYDKSKHGQERGEEPEKREEARFRACMHGNRYNQLN